MASDRAIRSLAALRNASSSRVLNLCNLSTARDAPKDILERPFFLSTNLNTTILLKHRLRANEIDLFPAPRSVATKVIIPFECSDLRIGGRSFFIGQIGFEELVQEVGNHKTPEALERDVALMDLIDQTPSLDPFMLRQKLRAHDYDPHPAYFSISAADLQRIQSYAVKELQQLTRLAHGSGGGGLAATGRMAAALLSTEVDEKLLPLRLALGMSPEEFAEGVFSWRGLIYYKWAIQDGWPQLMQTLREVASTAPIGAADADQRSIVASKKSVIGSARQIARDITRIISIYDASFCSFTLDNRPQLFREFLVRAPLAFGELGEKLGAMQHIASFWRYRFPKGIARKTSVDELLDIFEDFKRSLGIDEAKIAAPARCELEYGGLTSIATYAA